MWGSSGCKPIWQTGQGLQWNDALDNVQTSLDVAGMVPGVGEAADLANAGISTARGNYGEAALSVAAMVPLAGSGATATKLATKYGDEVVGAAGKVADAVCSFTPDTPVATADGSVAISHLAVGDTVLAWDETTGSTSTFIVTNVLIHLDPTVVHLTIDGEQIETTPEHPFFVLLRGWVPASELHIGDWVRSADGSYGSVQVLTSERRPQLMYNLTVATAHTFFVGEGRWLVHNICGEGTIDRIYRAVTPAEARDLKQTGAFRSPNTSGAPDGKYFAETPAHANEWEMTMYGKGNYSVVAAKVPKDVSYYKFDHLDNIGPARFYDADALPHIRYRGPVTNL